MRAIVIVSIWIHFDATLDPSMKHSSEVCGEEEQVQRSEAILHAYSKAFAGLSADELLLLDGVVSEELPAEKHIPEKRRIRNGARRGRK